MTSFCLFQLSSAAQARVANPSFLAAATLTFTPVWNWDSKAPLPAIQTASWFWAWQTLAVRQKSTNDASAIAALRRNRTGVFARDQRSGWTASPGHCSGYRYGR